MFRGLFLSNLTPLTTCTDYYMCTSYIIIEDLCFLKLCKAGRQCVVINKVATCQCVTYCPDHMHLVCGNDGRTYHNPCQLHQTACIEQRHIKVAEKGPCIG